MLIWHRVGYVPYLGLTKSSYRRERNHLGVYTVLFSVVTAKSKQDVFVFWQVFATCFGSNYHFKWWSIRFQAEGEIGVPDGKERLEAKKKTYKNLHQKMISGLKRNRKCKASSGTTSSARIQCPHGPSKTRGSWGESWQNRGRMGQASACRPDHKIKAAPTARKRWKFIQLTDRNLVHENNSPTKWPSIVHSLTVQSNEAVRRISQFHISTGSMLKSDKQKRTVKRKSSRKGENGSEWLTKRLINKK